MMKKRYGLSQYLSHNAKHFGEFMGKRFRHTHGFCRNKSGVKSRCGDFCPQLRLLFGDILL